MSKTIKKYSIFDNNEIVNNLSKFGIVKEYSTLENDSTTAKVNKKVNKKLYTIFKWYLCIIIIIMIIIMIIYKVYKRK